MILYNCKNYTEKLEAKLSQVMALIEVAITTGFNMDVLPCLFADKLLYEREIQNIALGLTPEGNPETI